MSRLRQGAVLDIGLCAAMRASDWQLLTYTGQVNAIGTRINYPFHHTLLLQLSTQRAPVAIANHPPKNRLWLRQGQMCGRSAVPRMGLANSCCAAILYCCDYKAPPLAANLLSAITVLYSIFSAATIHTFLCKKGTEK